MALSDYGNDVASLRGPQLGVGDERAYGGTPLDHADWFEQLELAFANGEAAGRQMEAELMLRAQQGDHAAFGAIYRRYVTAIYRYCAFRVGQSVAEVEDLTSNVFLRAWQSIHSYHNQGKPVLAWLHTIAHNQVVDHLRRANRTVPLPDAFPRPDDFADDVMARSEHATLYAALEHLTVEQREVVIYQCLLGYSSQETGAVMGKRPGAVRALQLRALQALRQLLGKERP